MVCAVIQVVLSFCISENSEFSFCMCIYVDMQILFQVELMYTSGK